MTTCTLHNLLFIKNQNPSGGEFVNLFLSSVRKSGLSMVNLTPRTIVHLVKYMYKYMYCYYCCCYF